MFKSVCPVCPVTDMKRSLTFWERLGFHLDFIDDSQKDAAVYVGVRRETLSFHLQLYTPEDIKLTQSMAIRVFMGSRNALERLHKEWESTGIITAPLNDRPWGNREFGFYDPDKTPFFFCADL